MVRRQEWKLKYGKKSYKENIEIGLNKTSR